MMEILETKLFSFEHSYSEDQNIKIMSGEFEATHKPSYVLQDHFYGKGGVKLLNLVKNGKRVIAI